ncbi:MAG: tryptophan--tRNA ligase, partial [Candidatus Saccharimonadales bacterium]
MNKPVILTGLRANNDLHIGNYFGALLPIVDMAKNKSEKYQINLFLPDLHSFTTPIDHSKLQEQIRQTIQTFVAAGLPLDNHDVHIYRQSYISAHSELAWILSCFTDIGGMNRMTQFKEKSERMSNEDIAKVAIEQLEGQLGTEEKWTQNDIKSALKKEVNKAIEGRKNTVSVGLFNYPVLMASDILLYGAKYVPVGDDQSQHLEFTRDIAERMNKRFGELFIIPEPVKNQHEFFGKDQGLRIK